MTDADIDAGLRLCRASGWNQLESDWRLFLECNPGGCRVVETEGRVAGTVATLRYEDRFSWISMLLVDPEMRRRASEPGCCIRRWKSWPTCRRSASMRLPPEKPSMTVTDSSTNTG